MRTLWVVLLVGCSSAPVKPQPPANSAPPETPSEQASMVSIHRSGCFGYCPVYDVHVYRDGTVDYDGTMYVKTTGHASRTMSPAELAELEQLFAKYEYAKLADTYLRMSETDAPSCTTSYRPSGGLEKSVDHYLGDSSAPENLKAIEDGIDRIVKVELWIGTSAEREQLFSRH